MKTPKGLRVNDRVRAIKDHDYLGVSKRHVGVVHSIGLGSVEVMFVNKKLNSRTIIFCIDELRKAK